MAHQLALNCRLRGSASPFSARYVNFLALASVSSVSLPAVGVKIKLFIAVSDRQLDRHSQWQRLVFLFHDAVCQRLDHGKRISFRLSQPNSEPLRYSHSL